MAATTAPWTTEIPTALLVLADGTVIEGRGLGAAGFRESALYDAAYQRRFRGRG